MGLNNNQKSKIIKIAKEGGYEGDYVDLFNQAETDGVFDTQEVEIRKDDFKLSVNSLLVDKTPHRFNQTPTFMTSSHTVEPNSRSIVRFLMDEKYKPMEKPQQGDMQEPPKQMRQGGFTKEYSHGGSGSHPDTEKNKGMSNIGWNLKESYQRQGLDDWSHAGSWDEAYNSAKKWGVYKDKKDYEFTYNGKRYNAAYAGKPETELATYGVNDGDGNIIHNTDKNTAVVNRYDWWEDDRYPPSHIASYKYDNPDIFIDWASFKKSSVSSSVSKNSNEKNRTQKGSQTMVFNTDQKQFLKTSTKLQSLSNEELKAQGVLGGTIYKTSNGKKVKHWQQFYDDIGKGDIQGEEAYNFLSNNCSDVTADGFGLDMNGKKVCRVAGLVDSPAKVLDAIKLGFPTMNISGRDQDAYQNLYNTAQSYLKGGQYDKVLEMSWSLVNGNNKETSIGFIQEALKGKGYKLPKSTTKLGNVDQKWGEETKAQLEKWQEESGYWVRAEKTKMHEGGVGEPGDIGYIPVHDHPGNENHNIEGRGGLDDVAVERSESYTSLQNSLISKGYKVEVTGKFNNNTLEATHSYGQESLSHLPDWNEEWKWDDIGCSGTACSEQTTDMLQMLFPQSLQTNVDAGAGDSWYRQGYMLDQGGKTIWSQQGIGTYNAEGKMGGSKDLKLERIPPMESWPDFIVGDVVHLASSARDNMGNQEQSVRDSGDAVGYDQSTNTGAGHTGFIIGKDPKTGIPLVMHGVSGKMYVERMDLIDWKGGTDRDDPLNTSQKYFIQGVTRPPGLVDSDEEARFSSLAPFASEGDRNSTFSWDVNEEYYNNLDNNQKESADFFTSYMSGNIAFERRNDPARLDDNYFNNTREGQELKAKFQKQYVTAIPRENEYQPTAGIGNSVDFYNDKNNSPITRLSYLTGYTEAEIADAGSLVYGTYMTETGDPGFGGSEQKGQIMTWMKKNLTPEINSSIKAISKLDFTLDWHGVGVNDEGYLADANTPPSEGIMRIKVDWQVEDDDGKMTQLGRWYEKAGLIYKDSEGNWGNSLTAGDNALTATTGERGMANSIDAGILQMLYYKQTLREDDRYNAEDNTFGGVPLNMVVASKHKNPSIDRDAKKGPGVYSTFDYMKDGDRNYSNDVIQYSNMLTTTTNKYDIADCVTCDPEVREKRKVTLASSKTHVATKQDQTFMASKTNKIHSKTTGGESFFSKTSSQQASIITALHKIGEGQDVQAQLMIDKLRYGSKLRKNNPGYTDTKIMELVDEKFQVIQIPQDYQNENNIKVDMNLSLDVQKDYIKSKAGGL